MQYSFLLVLLPFSTLGQAFLPMDTLESIPPEISSKIDEKIERLIQVDFSGDGKQDYIVQGIIEDRKFNEWWMSSEFEPILSIQKYDVDYDYFGLINLDDDPEAELYSARGFSDGIDYLIYDLNLENGSRTKLFAFNPVIIFNNQEFWGYPWDTQGISCWSEDGVSLIYCSLDHNIERDGVISVSKSQNALPVIFLLGKPTQEALDSNLITNKKWMKLEVIRKAVMKP